jgi:hypothetical protein
MENIISKIKAYAGTNVDFAKDVIVVDRVDGNGAFILEWNIQSKPKPTDEQLNGLANEAIAIEQAEATAKAQKETDALAGNNKLLELGLTQAQVTAMTGYTPPVAE